MCLKLAFIFVPFESPISLSSDCITKNYKPSVNSEQASSVHTDDLHFKIYIYLYMSKGKFYTERLR